MHQKRGMQNTPNLPLVPKTVHKKHPAYRFRYLNFGVFCSEISYFPLDLISDFFNLRYPIYTLTLNIFAVLRLYLLSVFALISAFGFFRTERFTPLSQSQLSSFSARSKVCRYSPFLRLQYRLQRSFRPLLRQKQHTVRQEISHPHDR